MDSLVSWKKRRDKFQDNDTVSGMGDQVEGDDDFGIPALTGSPKEVKFIKRDETNASAMRKMGMKSWW